MGSKLTEEKNNLVWSSDAQQDYYFGMDRDELINEIESMDEVEDFLRIRGYDDIEEADEDELRSFLLPDDIDIDYEDFTESVMPMIKEQCANDVLVLWGKAANWRGAYDAGTVIDVDEFKNYIYPNYDAISEIRSDNGNLYYIQYSHDTPTGGDTMYLYSFKSDELYDNACRICDEKDDNGDIAWLGEFKDDAGYAEIAEAIELGYLTPVTNRFNEGLEESVNQNDLMDAVQDAYGYDKKEAKKYIDSIDDKTKAELIKGFKDNAKKSFLTDSLKEGYTYWGDAEVLIDELEKLEEESRDEECSKKFYCTWNFGYDKNNELTAGVDLRYRPSIEGDEQEKNRIKAQVEEAFELCGFELDSNIKHENPNQNLSGGWHYQIKKVDDADADVELTTDDMNGGQWYESLRKTESLNEGRYSDYADDETRANGWWYFTTHGVGPGSIPKDLNVLEVKEGQNKKGTWGDYVRLDGILNTDELDYYDMIELAPTEEEEDFSGFFSDYDFEESLDESEEYKTLAKLSKGLEVISYPYGYAVTDGYVNDRLTVNGDTYVLDDGRFKLSDTDKIKINNLIKKGIIKSSTNESLSESEEGFNVDWENNGKAKAEVTGWWKDVEKWNEENGSKFDIDNDYSDAEAMFTAIYDMLSELKTANKDLYKKGKAIYNKYAHVPIKEGKAGKQFGLSMKKNPVTEDVTKMKDGYSSSDLQRAVESALSRYGFDYEHGYSLDFIPKERGSVPHLEVEFPDGIGWKDYKRISKIFSSGSAHWFNEKPIYICPGKEHKDGGLLSVLFSPKYYDFDESLSEDTIKTKDGKWSNKYPQYEYTFDDGWKIIAVDEKEAMAKYEDIQKNRYKGVRSLKELDNIAQELYNERDRWSFNYFSDRELAILWALCSSPMSAPAYDDEVYDAIMNNPKASKIFKYGEKQFKILGLDKGIEDALHEDTVKTSDGKWTNKGKEGTHGKFKTKKEADAQRKAMFANNFKG